MNRVEKQVAEEVHDLLLEARPERDDVNLARAAEITSVCDPNANDDFRANVSVAVQQQQSAIAEDASASEAANLLLDAIRAAEHWAAQVNT